MIQSFPEASPVKWHQVYPTLFFETSVLRPFLAGYKPFREEFHRLFGNDCLSSGQAIPESSPRAPFSRPSLEDVVAFRAHVDEAMLKLMIRPMDAEAFRRAQLGLNHEQRHQELTLTDIKHAFFSNSAHPGYEEPSQEHERREPHLRLQWHHAEGGVIEIGHPVSTRDPLDFCLDDETPRHRVCLERFRIANRLVTCREYLEFMGDDAYMRPALWLADGWEAAQQGRWEAPLYWERDCSDVTGWRIFTLRGWRGLAILLDTPVCHVSFFEADAFARWRGCRLPAEAEWECVARQETCSGNLLEAGELHPRAAAANGVAQLFGDCWEWTASPYAGYPGYEPHPEALSDSDRKFMTGQIVLRGGSCLTPADHVRATSRRFLRPAARWQCSGIRLAMGDTRA